MIATKLQAYQGLSGEKRNHPKSYLSEYFCVVSEHQYSTARTDDFEKVVGVQEEEGWSRGNMKIL